jgi:hypothetical protein
MKKKAFQCDVESHGNKDVFRIIAVLLSRALPIDAKFPSQKAEPSMDRTLDGIAID